MKKLYIGLTCSMMFLASCSDVLDITPTDSYSDPVLWQDQNLIKMFVNDQYNTLGNTGNFFFLPFFTDEVYQKYNNGGCNNIRENILTSDNIGGVNDILHFWNTGYSYLRNINTYFKNIETSEVPDDFKKEMTAEIKFLRAYTYAKLIWAYGGVPIVEEAYSIDSDWSQVKRNTYDECVTYILKDLKDVIETLPDRPNERNRASANAARALKARVLLYYASPLNNPNNDKDRWQQASDAAKELFDKGYELCDDYRKMFLDAGNSEYIFAREFSETYSHVRDAHFASPADGGRGWGTPSQNIVDAYETTDGEIPVLNSTTGEVNPNSIYDPANPYKNRDPRFYDCIYYNGSKSIDGRIIETFQKGADMLTQDMTMTSYYMRKFQDESLGTYSFNYHYTTPHPYFRLAEMYLNYAEAEYHLGHEDVAREYVNKVRSRKSVDMPDIEDTGENLLKRIYHERQIELAFEGHRYFDLRRWKIADNTPIIGTIIEKEGNAYSYKRYTLSLTSREKEWKDAFYLLPIHYSEIQKSNKSLEQNPGYN